MCNLLKNNYFKFIAELRIYVYTDVVKAKITLLVDQAIWRAFRAACIERGLVSGKMIEEFMRSQIKKWGARRD